MNQPVKLLLIVLLVYNCSTSRYVLNDQNKADKNFLISKINESKAKGEISSNKPIIVVDGKPFRYNFELKENKLELVKSDIKKIDVLKKEVGMRIYGDFAEGGVMLITTTPEVASKDTNSENSDIDNKNILFLVDGKQVTSEVIKSINPNDIDSVDVLKDEASKKLYPDKSYDGIIHVKMKKK
ncbi:hypothetical protein VP395_09240 [Mariniflexile soesokkakense]|uniref:TonB-dependent receptor plug domain-containing protein n=1 Tax=Mariniflexile soesokkakense TaxID=1343160 RepID=A0ABV0AD92_9FLAO